MKKILVSLMALALLFTGCGSQPQTVRDFMLNTEVFVTVYRRADGKAAEKAMELCREMELIFSRTDEQSELSRLNRREISQVSSPLAEVIALGLKYSQASGGAFDITLGSVTSLWDFSAQDPAVPHSGELAAALEAVGWEKVHLEGNTVTFDHPGTRIDLGSIAKGYIADRMADKLRAEGVSSAIISLGGNLYFLGAKPGGEDYQAGIQFPFQERNETIGGLPVREQSLVTSGIYERCFTLDGKLYHHILNAATGMPVENELVGVSILSSLSVEGDALSTVCFALGLEEGMAFIESLEGVEAVFVTGDMQVHLSSGLEGVFYQ